MKRPAVVAVVALAAAGCAFNQAPATAPLCAGPETNIYVDQGGTAHCRLQIGQRYVVKMPKSQGSVDAMRTLCLGTWKGTDFVVGGALDPFDYCVLPKRTT